MNAANEFRARCRKVLIVGVPLVAIGIAGIVLSGFLGRRMEPDPTKMSEDTMYQMLTRSPDLSYFNTPRDQRPTRGSGDRRTTELLVAGGVFDVSAFRRFDVSAFFPITFFLGIRSLSQIPAPSMNFQRRECGANIRLRLAVFHKAMRSSRSTKIASSIAARSNSPT